MDNGLNPDAACVTNNLRENQGFFTRTVITWNFSIENRMHSAKLAHGRLRIWFDAGSSLSFSIDRQPFELGIISNSFTFWSVICARAGLPKTSARELIYATLNVEWVEPAVGSSLPATC